MKAEAVNCGNRSLAEYLVVVSQLEGWLVPLDMTTWELSSQVAGFGGPLGLIIVILGDSATAEDFCVFWNLRASQPLLLSKGLPLLLPASAFDSEGTLQFLAEWCINRTERTNSLILVSASVNAQELATIEDRFKPLLQDQFLVDLWYRNFSFSKVQRYESRHKEENRVTGRTLNIRPPRPGWWDQSQTGMEWVIDLDLRSHPLVGDGYIPPKYPKLNHVLAGEPELEYVKFGRGYLIRSSGECLSLRVGKTNDFLQITLPDDDRLFRSLLRSKGCGSVITEKSRYARGMLRLLGGYQEVQTF